MAGRSVRVKIGDTGLADRLADLKASKGPNDLLFPPEDMAKVQIDPGMAPQLQAMLAQMKAEGAKSVAKKASQLQCAVCGKKAGNGVRLSQCSRCKAVKYCGPECQKGHWPTHKAECVSPALVGLLKATTLRNPAALRAIAAATPAALGQQMMYDPGEGEQLFKWSAVHEAVRLQDANMLALLLQLGAANDLPDADGETPLFVAVLGRWAMGVQLLGSAGANPNHLAGDGWSGLMIAARDGDVPTVKALLACGAAVEGPADMFGRQALDLVCFFLSKDGPKTEGVTQKQMKEVEELLLAASGKPSAKRRSKGKEA